MKPTITYPDFNKLDLRIGQVLDATLPAWSEKLIELTVDFGQEIGQKTIFAGLRAWYQPVDFVGKKFPFIVNLQERKMGEGISQGMMLVADETDKPILLPLPEQISLGCPLA